MTAERGGQRQGEARCLAFNLSANRAKNTDISAAELIDALLRIANGKERAAPLQVRQRMNNLPLRRVGVLEFINQQMLELGPAVAPPDVLLLEKQRRQPFQVIEIELRVLPFALAICRLHLPQKLMPERQHRRRRAVDITGRLADFGKRFFDPSSQVAQ